MRILVTGGRDYTNRIKVYETLDRFIDEGIVVSKLVHGAARGLDTLAADWADSRGVPADSYTVTSEDWNRLGKAEGHIRNKKMLESGKT